MERAGDAGGGLKLDTSNCIRWLADAFGSAAPETNPTGLGAFVQNLRIVAGDATALGLRPTRR